MSTTNNKSNSQYENGKALGLEGTRGPIDVYKNALPEDNKNFKEAAEAALKIIKDRATEMTGAFSAFRNQIDEENKKYYGDIKALLEHLKGLWLLAEVNHKDIPELMKQFKEQAITRFDNTNTIVSEAYDALKNGLSILDAQLKSMIDKIENDHTLFIELLKNKDLDFTDLENGYLYGNSLKISLGGK